MSVQIQKGAVKFNSIMAMARCQASKTNEPVGRVYIRLWKRIKEGNKSGSQAFHTPTRKYRMAQHQEATVN